MHVFRIRFALRMLRSEHGYYLQHAKEEIQKILFNSYKPPDGFYRTVQVALKQNFVKLTGLNSEAIKSLASGSILIPCKESDILQQCGIDNVSELENFNFDGIPKQRRRKCESAATTVANTVKAMCRQDDNEIINFKLQNPVTSKQEPVYELVGDDNLYALCYWNATYNSLSGTDLKKINDQNWNPLKFCLSTREAEITWRFKHGALCTPKLAFQLGLRANTKCFFCDSSSPTWRHIIICDSFTPMWKTIQGIIAKAGCEWKQSMFFRGIPGKKFKKLNNVIHAGYLVIHEYSCFQMNSVPYKHEPSVRVRQLIFEMIFTNFKSHGMDLDSQHIFLFEWEILEFLFKVCGRSIDIRIPQL